MNNTISHDIGRWTLDFGHLNDPVAIPTSRNTDLTPSHDFDLWTLGVI